MSVKGFFSTLEQISSQYNSALASALGVSIESFAFLMTLLAVWTVVWKGLALWKASQKKSLLWFVILLIISDFGILEILYYFWFSKINSKDKTSKRKRKK